MQVNIFTLEKVKSGDTYEIAYAHSYPNKHWSETSLYFSDEDDGVKLLEPYFNKVFDNFAYYGVQKITTQELEKLKDVYHNDPNKLCNLTSFFITVENWLKNGNKNADYFYILGI